MRVTTWAEYGLIVSVHLAKRAGEGPIAARELSEHERLPHDYVEQILLRLRRAGLVESVRRARGARRRRWTGFSRWTVSRRRRCRNVGGRGLRRRRSQQPATPDSLRHVGNRLAQDRCSAEPTARRQPARPNRNVLR